MCTGSSHVLSASHACASSLPIWQIPESPFWFIHFELATSPLPTLHCLLCIYMLLSHGFGVWGCFHNNHAEGQSRGEEGGRNADMWMVGGKKLVKFPPSLATDILLAHPSHCVVILIISAAKPVTAAASLSVSLCLLSHCWRCGCPCVELKNVTKGKEKVILRP